MPSPRPDARSLALAVLRDVEHNGAYANLALPKALGESELDERDRAFATELVYGSLRRQGELDIVISRAASRDVEKIDSLALAVLRLGVYQMLHLRVPDHAAVDQCVRLARAEGAHKATGFINAVLRAVGSKGSDHWLALIEEDPSSVESHPLWIAAEIELALGEGESSHELGEALRAHNQAPLVTVACLPGFSEPTAVDNPTVYSPLGFVVAGGNPSRDERVANGVARIQDEGSQLAALILSRVEALSANDRILDMCAGPGGKTAVLAAEAARVGAAVLALEKIPHRVGLVRDSTRAISQRHPGVLGVEQGDARDVVGEFSRVLLDAPCSGLGALRRRPEARWRKSHRELVGLGVLQEELLDAGLRVLAPGGFLAYVTCSPVVRETSEIVASVLARYPEVSLVDTSAVLDRVSKVPVAGAARGNAVQLWTHRHGTDAMFIQLLRREDGR